MSALRESVPGKTDVTVLAALRATALPLTGSSSDYDALLKAIGDARFVLIGEASHGTHEFYYERARITRRLIEEKGFHAVAVEADWPDAYRVNRYLRGQSDNDTPLSSLDDFQRFPLWMWRNTVVLDFITVTARYNASVPEKHRVGFYGLDLYSLYRSIAAVIGYLEGTDPEAAKRARDRYGCLEFADSDPQRYGMEASFGVREPCEDAVIEQLTELLRNRPLSPHTTGPQAAAERFYAEQNARLIVDAEAYYRNMFRGGRDSTWNLRDTHMADTLDALDTHLSAQNGEPAKIIVWAHNSHLGDARATEMGQKRAERNLGEIARKRHDGDTFLIGMTTYTGTVTAATDWDGSAQTRRIRTALKNSVEDLMHEVGEKGDFYLNLRSERVRLVLGSPRLQRAIGVIYSPETERWSHYFESYVAEQYDALLHFETTHALRPLDSVSERTPESPDTFPIGI